MYGGKVGFGRIDPGEFAAKAARFGAAKSGIQVGMGELGTDSSLALPLSVTRGVPGTVDVSTLGVK